VPRCSSCVPLVCPHRLTGVWADYTVLERNGPAQTTGVVRHTVKIANFKAWKVAYPLREFLFLVIDYRWGAGDTDRRRKYAAELVALGRDGKAQREL
jgi:hypothetical protein